MKIIMVVGDKSLRQFFVKRVMQARPDATVLEAPTVEDARTLFHANQDADLVMVEGYPSAPPTNPEPESMSFVAEVDASGFAGELVAISGNDAVNAILVGAGCDAAWDKTDVPGLLLSWLCAQP